jgi:hypothetical protein
MNRLTDLQLPQGRPPKCIELGLRVGMQRLARGCG